MVTSIAPRTGLRSAKEIFPTVATCLFSVSLVRFPLMLEIITARVASRMRCLLICFEK